MKVLFLDIDGVLVTLNSEYASDMQSGLVENLASVIRQTGTKIVVSSSWKVSGIDVGSTFEQELKKASSSEVYSTIMSAVIDRTDDLVLDGFTREDEILKYVNENNIDKFVAVDDAAMMFPSRPDWLVVTNPYRGLTVGIKNKLIARLS